MSKPCEISKEKGDYCCDHVDEQDNYFFKILTIPDAFVKHFRGKLARTIKLESRDGCTFDAQIINNSGELVLQSGWDAFVSAHDLKVGDFLLFKYNGISQLEVLIFDPSGCEKVQSCLVNNNTDQEPIDIPGSFHDVLINSPQSDRPNLGNEIVNISSSRSQREASEDDLDVHPVPPYILPKGTVLTDVQKKKLGKWVQAIQSKKPIYGCILNTGSIGGKPHSLFLSRNYADTYLPFDNESLILERHGKNWEVRCSVASFKRKRFTKGWKKFACDNSLKVGNLCLFEPLKKKNKQYIMKVHVIRDK